MRPEEDILIVAHAGQHKAAVAAIVELRPRILLCSSALAARRIFAVSDDTAKVSGHARSFVDGRHGRGKSAHRGSGDGALVLNRDDLRLQLPKAMRGVDGGEATGAAQDAGENSRPAGR